MKDKNPAKPGSKAPELIRLDDLLPQKNVQGGKGKQTVIFGAVDKARRNRRPGSDL